MPPPNKFNVSPFFGHATKQPLADEKDALKKVIDAGDFSKTASSGAINFKALIALARTKALEPCQSNEQKPTFDFIASKDALTIRVANRIIAPLKELGFDPRFIFKTYKKPEELQHPQVRALALQNEVLNQVVFRELDGRISEPDDILTPSHMSAVPGITVLDDVDRISSFEMMKRIRSPDRQAGITHLFRLYEKITPKFIALYNNTPTKRNVLTNIHPSVNDHGVIPPFWTQLRMLKLMDELKLDFRQAKPEEVAQICLANGVNPYPTGMVHHVAEEFDTGDIILAGNGYKPLDLRKCMWENYFGMEEFIVDSTLAVAAAYILGLDLNGQAQDFQQTAYHSWPGRDSHPPESMTDRAEIIARDSGAMSIFEQLGGRLSDPKHFNKIIYGDPEHNIPGFVTQGTNAQMSLTTLIEEAYGDRLASETTRGWKAGNDNPSPTPQ